MRYQQKQRVEIEQKRNELVGGRGLGPLDGVENGKTIPANIGNGKVSLLIVTTNKFYHISLWKRIQTRRCQSYI